MLSYQHAYHAGNHADVLKHVVLCLVIDYLKQKEKPFYFHDTHAGRGLYPFNLPEMQKLQEHNTGINKLWPLLIDEQRCTPPLLIYRNAINRFNPSGKLTCYPGSGLFAHALMRDTDSLMLTELHPGEYAQLQNTTRSLSNVRIQNCDAWQGLKAALPPKQSRGVILIDPSYEMRNEQDQVIAGVSEALRRFATGVYLIWYPLLARDGKPDLLARKLLRGIEQLAPASLLRLELSVHTEHGGSMTGNGMIGSGMLVINAPWQLDTSMKRVLPQLHQALAIDATADYRMQWVIEKK